MLSLRVVLEADPDVDDEARERLARRLRTELLEQDCVESVAFAADASALQGAKSGDAVTFGALLVALSASGGVLTGLVETLRDWLGRTSGRNRISVTIDGDTLELEHATTEQQHELLEAYLRRHAGS